MTTRYSGMKMLTTRRGTGYVLAFAIALAAFFLTLHFLGLTAPDPHVALTSTLDVTPRDDGGEGPESAAAVGRTAAGAADEAVAE